MKCIKIILIIFISNILFSGFVEADQNEEYPIVFVHGNKAEGTVEKGWKTWGNIHSVMHKIDNERYKGYRIGLMDNGISADSCWYGSNLQPMPDKKVMYNFSFYNPDESRGVIGSNGIYYPVDNSSPRNIRQAYIASANHASWAEHLSMFIDSVLVATEATKVNIVAHSMGGLVTRASIAYYGCESKINKIITIGTPHHSYSENAFIDVVVANLFPGAVTTWWEKKGELLEMGINYWGPIYGDERFTYDGSNSTALTWCDYLYQDEPKTVPIVAIAGTNPSFWSEGMSPNDGAVKVDKAHLNYAVFNPNIYANHSNGPVEITENTCTYLAEFVKRWMIDDMDTFVNAPTPNSNSITPYPSSGTGSIRTKISMNYSRVLSITSQLFYYSGSVVYPLKGSALNRYSQAMPGYPVYSTSRPPNYMNNYYLVVRVNDMNHGEVCEVSSPLTLLTGQVSAYVSLNTIGDCGSESQVTVSWTTNDYAVFQKLYYKGNGIGWSPIATLNGIARSYAFGPLSTGDYQVKIEFYLDAYTPIAGISNTFNIYYEPPRPTLQLDGYIDVYPFSTKAQEANHAHLSWILNRPEGDSTIIDSFVIYKDSNRYAREFDWCWTDPVKYTYIGESHTYRLRGWYISPFYNCDVYIFSNYLTLTADTVNPDTGCPYFYIKENGAYIPQNTIMHYGYSNNKDNYLFNYSIKEKDELRKNGITDDRCESEKRVIKAAISENEAEKDYIDRINLKAVKYDSIYNLTLNTKGEYLFWKDINKIDSCKNAKGEDILSLVKNMGDSFYMAYPRDTIYIYTSQMCCDKANNSENRSRGGSIVTGLEVKPKDNKGKDIEPSIDIKYMDGKSWANRLYIIP
jgi:pimeloyl-ACP methyl ester carboxylesterase